MRGAVWPLGVVVGHVAAEHVFEVAAAEDQQPVETVGADRADEPLRVGVRLWRLKRRLDDLDAGASGVDAAASEFDEKST